MANRTKAAFVVLDRDGLALFVSFAAGGARAHVKEMEQVYINAAEAPALGPRYRIVDAVVTFKSTKATKDT